MKKRKICVVTGTRAEYGLLYWTMKAIQESEWLELQIIATGMHLSPEFGMTVKNIENDGFVVDKKIEILLSGDSTVSISKSMGLGMISFSEAFQELKPDVVLILGDRFEIFSVSTAAMISRIPIAHCHGGEATQGLIDEPIRHSITKMSQIHFTSTNEYRDRVIQMGEQPKSVFNVGALGIENINKISLLNENDFIDSINFDYRGNKLFLVTFHPVTLEENSAAGQFEQLLQALDSIFDVKIIFTKANSDTDGRIINQMIDNYVQVNFEKARVFTSLGQLRYLSALQFVDLVIGNSSSGIIEVPSFGKPTVNIGDRQLGRIKATSIIDCDPVAESITAAIGKALSNTYANVENPYGTRNSSELIVNVLEHISLDNILKKEFYNIEY